MKSIPAQEELVQSLRYKQKPLGYRISTDIERGSDSQWKKQMQCKRVVCEPSEYI